MTQLIKDVFITIFPFVGSCSFGEYLCPNFQVASIRPTIFPDRILCVLVAWSSRVNEQPELAARAIGVRNGDAVIESSQPPDPRDQQHDEKTERLPCFDSGAQYATARTAASRSSVESSSDSATAFRTAVGKPGILRPASDSDWAAVDHAHDDGMRASTSRRWMKLPSVYPLTIPSSHRMTRRTAIVSNMFRLLHRPQ